MTGQKVSLTTNTWTSVQNMTYMCITAHWIDSNWTLQKRIVKFKHIEDHKGSSIGAELDDAMKEWGLENHFASRLTTPMPMTPVFLISYRHICIIYYIIID